MTPNEQRMKRVLQDAIAMVRWHHSRPVTAQAWADWVETAIAAIDHAESPLELTQIWAKPFTRAELRKAAKELA